MSMNPMDLGFPSASAPAEAEEPIVSFEGERAFIHVPLLISKLGVQDTPEARNMVVSVVSARLQADGFTPVLVGMHDFDEKEDQT